MLLTIILIVLLPRRRVVARPRRAPRRRRCRCAVRCSADSADEFSFASLRAEAERRGRSDGLFGGEDLGKFDRLRKEGRHDRTSPRQVVEHVLTEMREGDLQQAFDFTSCPPWRQDAQVVVRLEPADGLGALEDDRGRALRPDVRARRL